MQKNKNTLFIKLSVLQLQITFLKWVENLLNLGFDLTTLFNSQE